MGLGLIVLIGFVFYATPRVTRPGLLFAVTVDPAFAAGDEARRILRRYDLEIAAHTAIALALGFATSLPFGFGWLFLGWLLAFIRGHGEAMTHAAAQAPFDQSGPGEQPGETPLGALLAVAPLALLLVLSFYLRSRWDQIPNPFPEHFGFHGPDRWVARSPESVYTLIAVNGVVCLLMLLIRYGLLYKSRRVALSGDAARAETSFRRIILWLLVAVEYLIVALTCTILFSNPQGAIAVGIALTVLTVGVVGVLVRMGQGGARAARDGRAGDGTPDACWKWGLFYFNPRDPALFVEKRFGIGYTLNFGNRLAWLFLLVPLLPLGIRLLMR